MILVISLQYPVLNPSRKYSAAAAFDDGKLVSTKFFVKEMEKDFEQRKQAQKSCYIRREENLAKVYEVGWLSRVGNSDLGTIGYRNSETIALEYAKATYQCYAGNCICFIHI